MALITLRILDGADRGRIFEDLPTPVTIGREDGNSIQLNDERISRFHLKIQEDGNKLVLTDLESTNGTKVNGEDTQLRILRFGDVISLGRSVLLFGSKSQISNRLEELRRSTQGESATLGLEDLLKTNGEEKRDWDEELETRSSVNSLTPPALPEGLSPGQAAQVAELIGFVHIRLRDLINAARVTEDGQDVMLQSQEWQTLLELQARLAQYLRGIGEPAS